MSNIPDLGAVQRVNDSANADKLLVEITEFEGKCAKMGCTSPIEILFAYAVTKLYEAVGHLSRTSFQFTEHIPVEDIGTLCMVLSPQVKVGSYRVDFTLTLYSPNGLSVIAIECDGYEYHHGSPESAARDKARDREISKRFDAVLRFTGSEIYSNAYKCASEAVSVVLSKIDGAGDE